MPSSQSDSRAREQRVFDLAARYKRERDEAREQLAAMTAARDHCKAAATRAGENHIGVLTWLRDNHSEVYEEAIEAHGWG